MADYTFETLNSNDFEKLCCDLIGAREGGKYFERFKPGSDGGIDGRCYTSSDELIIIQCKHWVESDFSKLKSTLKNKELPKVLKLNPNRYILAISKPLSVSNKNALFRIFNPYIKRTDDILGRDDLNVLIDEYDRVLRKHYKLYLNSSKVLCEILNQGILGRSHDTVKLISKKIQMYVVTKHHEDALSFLRKKNVIIINGESGIGKTLLAQNLALESMNEGFEFIAISDNLSEAEAVFDPNSKQVFYYDDFLGSNMSRALSGHEGSNIVKFIKRILLNINKRFILTSRCHILNQAKKAINEFEHSNIHSYEYYLNLSLFSRLDKALILYNNIQFNRLSDLNIVLLVKDKKYINIIEHKNFSPRLIEYFTDPEKICLQTDSYLDYINDLLSNPKMVWEHPFNVQLNGFCRFIVVLVAFNGKNIKENDLQESYQCFIDIYHKDKCFDTSSDFQNNMAILIRSFLKKTSIELDSHIISLFNPSIADFIFNKYSNIRTIVIDILFSLRTRESLAILVDLKNDNQLMVEDFSFIINTLLCKIDSSFKSLYISYLNRIIIENQCISSSKVLHTSIDVIMNNNSLFKQDEYFVLDWALNNGMISASDVIEFLSKDFELLSRDGYLEIILLLSKITITLENFHEVEFIKNNIIEKEKKLLDLFISDYEKIYDTNSDILAIRDILTLALRKKLIIYGKLFDHTDIKKIIDNFDVENSYEGYEMFVASLPDRYDEDGSLYFEMLQKEDEDIQIDNLFNQLT